MEKQQLRWGIMGCANIAKHSVIPGIQKSKHNQVVAIASRTLATAQQTAEQLNIPTAYGSYEELLQDEQIDAVYIPLPNHLHKEWTLKAAAAGKHVLCEKPIALTADEAAEMIAACQDAGVHLAEAFMYRHHPRYQLLKEVIASGDIGEIRAIRGSFTFNSSANHGNVRFKQEWGGGSVYDVGCYPITAARLLLEQEPEAVTAHAFFSPEHDNVDMMTSGLIEFPNAVALSFDCGMWAGGRNTLEIVGSTGYITVPNAFVSGSEDGWAFFVHNGKEAAKKISVPIINQYAQQADDFAAVVLQQATPIVDADDAYHNMRIIDAILLSARTRTRVVL
jgi:xylose dehydrogenase (NAD/NADP)